MPLNNTYARMSVVAAMLTASLITIFCSYSRAKREARAADSHPVSSTSTDITASLPLVSTPTNVDVGRLAPGTTKQLAIRITNTTGRPTGMVAFATSCDCVTVTPSRLQFLANDSAELSITIDLRTEPSFRGALGVELIGRAIDDSKVFYQTVSFSVGDR
jgi:hypothetical protein